MASAAADFSTTAPQGPIQQEPESGYARNVGDWDYYCECGRGYFYRPPRRGDQRGESLHCRTCDRILDAKNNKVALLRGFPPEHFPAQARSLEDE